MEYKDFELIQNQLIEILIDYSYFLKKGAQLDYKYCYTFKDEIAADFKIRNENTMLMTAIQMLADKKSLDEVDNYIEEYKKNYAVGLNQMNQKLLISTNATNNRLDDEHQKLLDDHFNEMIKNYYPALRMTDDQEYIRSFELLQLLYQQNNYDTYFASYELFKDKFVKKDYHGVNLEKYANFYFTFMQRITVDTNQRKNKFPYIKEEVFEDEITVAREKGDFKARINKLIEANKAIKKDFKEVYGEIIEL